MIDWTSLEVWNVFLFALKIYLFLSFKPEKVLSRVQHSSGGPFRVKILCLQGKSNLELQKLTRTTSPDQRRHEADVDE